MIFAIGICVAAVSCKSPVVQRIPPPDFVCFSKADVEWLADMLPRNLNDPGFVKQARMLQTFAYCQEAEAAQ